MTDFAPDIKFGGVGDGATSSKQDEIIQELVTLNTTDFSTEAKQEEQITLAIALNNLIITLNTLTSKDDTLKELSKQLSFLLDRMEFGMITDNAKALYVVPKSLPTLGQVTLVPTVGSLTNQARIGDIQAQRVVDAQMDSAFVLGISNNLTI